MSDPSAIPATWMRGGTSKGLVLLARDLPAHPAARDRLLLRIMGSPDARQVDGLGGGDPLSSKVAVVSPAAAPGADVDYRFLQVWVTQARVSADQPCGNMLAAVAAFAIEQGLVEARDGETRLTIRQVNDGSRVRATVRTPGGFVTYAGDTAIPGVPGTASPILLGLAPGPTRLPTGRPVDEVEGLEASLVESGMPVVVLAAADLGLSGRESPGELEADAGLRARVERVRRAAALRMGLGDVATKTVPKVALVAPPAGDAALSARMFIPHRVHAALGVLAGITLAVAARLPAGPAARLARLPPLEPEPAGNGQRQRVRIEHPSGHLECVLNLSPDGEVVEATVVRTARKLMAGLVFA